MQKERIAIDVVRQRVFLLRLGRRIGVAKACERMGKHRSFYYYWDQRYRTGGWRALVNQSRRPKRMPRLTSPALEKAVVCMRKRTNYGKERLHDCLKDRGITIPVSTIGKILDRRGLLVKQRQYHTEKKHTRVYNLLWPGQRVQMDIKYVPSEIPPIGRRYYQYTVTDECTRMRYLTWHDSIWTSKVVQTLREAQVYFGFKIDTVQTDNGIEFTFDYTAQLTAKENVPKEHPLDVYCREVNIRHKLIPPGAKELQGKVERSHRTDGEEFYRTITRRINLFELRQKGKRWLMFYNFKRRHSSLGRKTPNAFMTERLKLYPERIAA